jgi:hypothetical protein
MDFDAEMCRCPQIHTEASTKIKVHTLPNSGAKESLACPSTPECQLYSIHCHARADLPRQVKPLITSPKSTFLVGIINVY